MQIDRTLLDKLAHLARLEFSESEAEAMIADMNAILAWVEKLKEVDTTGVQPLTAMSHEINSLREDQVSGHLDRVKALENAPATDGRFFLVPKVLD